MIVNERITAYINSLEQGNGAVCDAIEEEALSSYVPIIRKETSALLKTLVALKQPKAILEVGTAVGYSALLMSRVMPENCRITTIEKYEKRIPIAKDNFKRAGKEQCITLLEGDAEEILKTLSGPYDFIFMDAAKGQYLHWLPMLLALLPKGGVLVSDNVLQDGDIIESRYAVERRNRTIHSRMREYLYTLTHMEEFETSVVPIGDGVTISVKR
ncbi:MAG: O-methyltransferase [Otoolea sp.]|nr:O-methyltransferase [Clostridiaceae bacterium]MDD6073892.1 O-methyltransferase [Clostridium sp.]MDY5484157.1 O-methyltransferase [Clostridium sp.]